VDERLFAEIAQLLAALSHPKVLRIPVCGLLIRLKALLHCFYVLVELSGVHAFEAVLPLPILPNQLRRADTVHPIYFCSAAQRTSSQKQDVAVGGGSCSALVPKMLVSPQLKLVKV